MRHCWRFGCVLCLVFFVSLRYTTPHYTYRTHGKRYSSSHCCRSVLHVACMLCCVVLLCICVLCRVVLCCCVVSCRIVLCYCLTVHVMLCCVALVLCLCCVVCCVVLCCCVVLIPPSPLKGAGDICWVGLYLSDMIVSEQVFNVFIIANEKYLFTFLLSPLFKF